MVKSKIEQIKQSLDVSGAFDNCFFHTYATFLMANKLPMPESLFTFKSILGGDSIASNLQKRFPDEKSLSLFAEYSHLHRPGEEPVSPNFIVEKTLVIGFLMREWFATQMSKTPDIRDSMQDEVIGKFNTYKDFRAFMGTEDLLSGDEGVLYKANEQFLEYFFARPKEVLTEKEREFEEYFKDKLPNEALIAFWKAEGYQNYCQLFANPGTKLATKDVIPVMQALRQPFTVFGADAGTIQDVAGRVDLPKMEVMLDVMEAHYHLLKTDETASLLDEYASSYAQYKKDREAVLASEGNKLLTANTKPSLLVGAICPSGHLPKTPVQLFFDKVDSMQDFVNEQLKVQKAKEQEPQKAKEPEQQKAKEPTPLEPDKAQEPEAQQHIKDQKKLPNAREQAQKQLPEAEKNFHVQVALLQDKIQDLRFRKATAKAKHDVEGTKALQNAYNAATTLHKGLIEEGDKYFKEPTKESYATFKDRCTRHLDTAQEELSKHRGWKQILGNIALAILGAGVLYLAAGLINKKITGNFLFFKTESEKVVDKVKESVDKAAPSA